MFRRHLHYVMLSGIIMVPGTLLAQPPGRGGPPGGQRGGMRGGPPPEMVLQLFQQADSNQDGSVTKEEIVAAMADRPQRGRPGRGDLPPRDERGGPGGPPPHRELEGEHALGHRGPPPKPGQVLPEPVAESLNLTESQIRQLAALQAHVDERLAAILTAAQQEQLKDARPPRRPRHPEGERGNAPDGRHDRPQRPKRPGDTL